MLGMQNSNPEIVLQTKVALQKPYSHKILQQTSNPVPFKATLITDLDLITFLCEVPFSLIHQKLLSCFT